MYIFSPVFVNNNVVKIEHAFKIIIIIIENTGPRPGLRPEGNYVLISRITKCIRSEPLGCCKQNCQHVNAGAHCRWPLEPARGATIPNGSSGRACMPMRSFLCIRLTQQRGGATHRAVALITAADLGLPARTFAGRRSDTIKSHTST